MSQLSSSHAPAAVAQAALAPFHATNPSHSTQPEAAVLRPSVMGGTAIERPSTLPQNAPPVAAAPAPAMTARATTSSSMAGGDITAKNVATRHKVGRLLDITVNDQLKDLVQYAEEAVPEYFSVREEVVVAGNKTEDRSSVLPMKQQGGSLGPGKVSLAAAMQGAPAAEIAAAPPSADALCVALDCRTVDMHMNFLREFEAVYEVFNEVAAHVQALEGQCSSLASALNAHAQEAEEFTRHVGTLQSELTLVQQRARDIREFKERLNFGPEEQHILEEAAVDANYLNVLERAREVHRKSRTLLLSREFQDSAGAVMESTYTAIMKATEKIARYLLSLSATAGADGKSYDVLMAGMTADVPEVSHFYLRCVQVLFEESRPQWEKVVDEVARLRRASVLRRYFHLLTTGSATTSTGTYRAGAAGNSGAVAGDSERTGTRPLEAELNDPVVFFSSLFAWLHQTIVEEEDFLSLFFRGQTGDLEGTAATAVAAESFKSATDITATATTKAALLGYAFGGVCKHIHAALNNILERFVRATSVLGNGAAGGEGGFGLTPGKGPRGLTGSLTRLLFAATGRSMQPSSGSNTGGGGHGDPTAHDANSFAMIQQYSNVTSRTQQEAIVTSVLQGVLHGTRTCFALLELFRYYGTATFVPLLGKDSALTMLVTETAITDLLKIFNDYVALLSDRLFDSPAGIVYRLPVLRRLASTYAMELAGNSDSNSNNASALNNAGTQAAPPLPPRRYVLDFLLAHTSEAGSALDDSIAVANDMPSSTSLSFAATPSSLQLGASVTSTNIGYYTGNADQELRASAGNLTQVLQQMVLPPSPEFEFCLGLLADVLLDTERQQSMIHALKQQQQQQQQQTEIREEGKPEVYCTALMETLMKAPAQISSQVTLHNGLDEPCLHVMEYNATYALKEVLQRQEAFVLVALAPPSKPEAEAAGLTIFSVLDEKLAALRQHLLQDMAAATSNHYFSVSGREKGIGVTLDQLHNFYNIIATSGRLPALPLINALSNPAERAWQQRATTQHVCQLYVRLYEEVQNAIRNGKAQQLSPEEIAAFDDLAPRKLQVLMGGEGAD